MTHLRQYEPISGYSVPVVRVSDECTVLYTLSFTVKGEPLNPPIVVSAQELRDAWKAWQGAGDGYDFA